MNNLHLTTIRSLDLLWASEQECDWCSNALECDKDKVNLCKSLVREFEREAKISHLVRLFLSSSGSHHYLRISLLSHQLGFKHILVKCKNNCASHEWPSGAEYEPDTIAGVS